MTAHADKDHPEKIRCRLRLDEDIIAWFKAQGSDYHVLINTILRQHMQTHDKKSAGNDQDL